MAEINLEHKKRPIWPWILGLLVLLLLVWLVVGMMRPDTPDAAVGTVYDDTAVTTGDTAMAGSAAGAAVVPPQLQQYLSTCSAAAGSEPSAIGTEHEYTTTCLSLLADSMSAVAAQRPMEPQLTQQLTAVRQRVDSVRQSDASSLEHSNQARDAAMASAEALGAMQRAYAGTNPQVETSVGTARDAAQQIQGSQALLDQKEALTRFFREAGNALQAMTSAPGV